ncbi:MAG: hypothetical protein WBP13_00675 [Methylophilaceae bacterium]
MINNNPEHKEKPINSMQFLIQGKPLKRCNGMIYWYWYGEHQFDIRVIRKLCGVAEEHQTDKWFMKKIHPCTGFRNVAEALIKHIGDNNMDELIIKHDAYQEELSKLDEQQYKNIHPIARKGKFSDIGNINDEFLEDIPF